MPAFLEDLKEPINVLYCGEGGTGKTTAMAAMANLGTGKVLAINAESGVKAKALRQRGISTNNIEVFPSGNEELTFDSLEKEWLRVREELHEDPDAYIGVFWDSATEIHKALLDSVVAKAVIRADRAGKERDRHFIALEDYGVMTEQVRNLMRKFRDLPCHFAVSALVKREQDDDGSVTYSPSITPKLAIDLVGWMDIVCVTSVALVGGDEEFRGLFRPHGKYRGKDRLGAMPKWLVDPTFDRIVQYVDEDIDIDSDAVMKAAKERLQKAQAQEDSANSESKSTNKTKAKVSA